MTKAMLKTAYEPYEGDGGLVAGKRYYFPINNYGGVLKSGLFTGRFDVNASAILMTREGEMWSIPVKDLCIKR